MDGVSTDSMLASLRQTFSRKLPGGLTQAAEQRLQRAVHHFTREVRRVKGYIDEQEVLRLSYDSMASWYKRNTEQLRIPDLPSSSSTVGYEIGEETENPLELLDRMKKLTNAPAAAHEFGSTAIAEIEERIPVIRPVQPKDVIQKQEDVVKYREVEYNIMVNSKDRNWLTNRTENRYNFTVQFNPNRGVPQGESQQATILTRLRNIVRIEFIKAIFPVEGLDVLVPCNPSLFGGTDGPTNTFYSVLGLPYVTVTLDEFQGNNYGTSEAIDKSLAVCQYDATWRSDAYQVRDNTSRGYTLFFPKFMKAQRVYAPAPLSNLQSLHFQVQTPENQLLSTLPDATMVERILFGTDVSGDVSCYDTSNNEYIFIQTKEWFPLWAFSQMDRIKFDGLTFNSIDPTMTAAGATLIDWLQRPEGHGVLSTAYTLNASATPVTVALGANDCGYANMIVIRTRFQDPTVSGVCEPDRFTGSNAGDISLGAELAAYPPSYQEGGVLNLSRQVQMALRIITREPDIASSIRPDNV